MGLDRVHESSGQRGEQRVFIERMVCRRVEDGNPRPARRHPAHPELGFVFVNDPKKAQRREETQRVGAVEAGQEQAVAGARRAFAASIRRSSWGGLGGLRSRRGVMFSGVLVCAGLLIGEAEERFEVGESPPAVSAGERPETLGDPGIKAVRNSPPSDRWRNTATLSYSTSGGSSSRTTGANGRP